MINVPKPIPLNISVSILRNSTVYSLQTVYIQTRVKYSLTETRTSSVVTVSSSQLNMLNFIVTRFRFFRRVLELRLMPESLLS